MLLKKFADLPEMTPAGGVLYEELRKGFAIRVPERFNFVHDVVDVYARAEPFRRALVWCDDAGNEKVFNFADIAAESARTANFLLALGIKKGDAVMLILRRRYEFWFFLLALHRLGAVAVPATNMLLAEDIAYRANMAGIKAIITLEDEALQGEVEKALPQSAGVCALVTVGKPRSGWLCFTQGGVTQDGTIIQGYAAYSNVMETAAENTAGSNSDTMLLYFTSGTSGHPKMVAHNFTYPLGHIVTAKYWQNVIDGGLHLTVAETGWAKAMWGKIYGQWLCGSAVFAYDMITFKPALLLEKMARYSVTTFCAPPTVYRYLSRQNLAAFDLSALKHCTTAGEALEPLLAKKWLDLTGLVIYEGFGQTETTLLAGTFAGMEARHGSMGKPAPGYEIDITDNDGNSCGCDMPGEIVLRLENGRPFGMFAGYYKDEALTSATFNGNLYRTGDIAQRDKDGYLWFLGRKDDMIKSAGYRISPFEVESVLVKHPAVLECAVTGVACPKRGQAVKATIVLTTGWEPNPALSRELQEFVKKQTAPYKFPRIIEFADSLPKTISGKIRRAAIRAVDKLTAAVTKA
ncbi:MAG: AMP-binding protein [Spirochaetaceae bacterium]|jgi:acetyl-CoA synthetase|nr:AMP-binding protein [Spirochaetaceae bacterium]